MARSRAATSLSSRRGEKFCRLPSKAFKIGFWDLQGGSVNNEFRRQRCAPVLVVTFILHGQSSNQIEVPWSQ